MSRSGYADEIDDPLVYGRWRAQVMSSTRGKRGQKLLKDLIEALDAMPVKRLIACALKENGEYCALGVVGEKRGIKMDDLDPEDSEIIAANFDIAEPLAKEIVFMNDEYGYSETPEERWISMRKWAQEQITK